jgi:hypothetical protein
VQVVVLRLLFLSVLVMAIYTLFEADHSPEVADIVAGEGLIWSFYSSGSLHILLLASVSDAYAR